MPVDGGRSWCTGLAHDATVSADLNVRAQLRRGLRYAAGHAPDC
ncbi:hypothetical protein [Stenotrophomonas sp. PS02301]|nr:hypothetical protein [Stenotrophomonas sp. PS02301]